jgi:hypothetical protein
MIKLTYSCKTCNSKNIIKNGKNRAGSQTYKCKDCSNYDGIAAKAAITSRTVLRLSGGNARNFST